MSDIKGKNKSLRDKIFISNTLWCLIQCLVMLTGIVLFYFAGIVAIILIGKPFFDIPILLVLMWLQLFIFLKFKIEDEFSDCIDTH